MCKASSVYSIQSHDAIVPSLITPPTTTPTHGKLGEQRMQSTRKTYFRHAIIYRQEMHMTSYIDKNRLQARKHIAKYIRNRLQAWNYIAKKAFRHAFIQERN